MNGTDYIEFVDSILSPERNIFLENNLKAGDYIVLVEAYWSTNLVRSFNAGTYSEDEIEIELVPSNENTYKKCEYFVWKHYGLVNYNKMNPKGSRMASDGYNQAEIETF